ncbi:putative RNA-binding protein 28 [Scophthalmus maximus]|uniref:RNA-binding protein 28 n=1 Tax=Scophthalmus maximus TaxID=52904 RepID=A0A2U9BYP6_SCOMX|nr:putative RNA-binding protein 28 [Scophthalmus maximus]
MPAQTIFVASLPATATNQRLEEIFSEIGPVKQCFVVREKGTETCRGFGYVTYSMEEDAQQAMTQIKDYDGQRISLSVAKKKITDKKKTAPSKPDAPPKENEKKPDGFRKKLLKARLIIRNLSFKCSEDDLKQTFSKFGTVLEAKIPLKPDGKMRGFAFVLFKNVSQAAKALNDMNLKEIKGRQVAVDWAIPKDKFIATQQSSIAGNKNTEEATGKPSNSESDSEDNDDDEEEKQAAPSKTKVASKPAVQQVEESHSDDDDDDDDDGQEQESEEDEEEDNDDDGQEQDSEEDEDEDEEDDDDDDEEEEEEDDDEEDEEDDGESAQKKTQKKLLPSDVKEGRTVFIRNLSFDTEEEGLEEVLLQYGELNYIKIVVHPDTEHSKGCAFAQFKTKEAADRCMAAAEDQAENGGIRVDGRKLLIVAAVSKEDAAKLKVDKVKVETGTRNLYLAREGLIRAGTSAAEGVPEADMIKRNRFEEIKRAKLRDISVFVSKTRLCVHNLPKSVDDKKLRALCLQAVKGGKGGKGIRIPECRVMYDKKPEKGQVVGQSLGYGFVQFQEHEHALATLRYLNNNPDIFGSHKRPIVEFSLEDSRKLKIKELRQQKNKQFLQNRPNKGGAKPQSPAGVGEVGGRPQSSSSELRGKESAPPQNQKRDKRFSGFQTNPEVEHIDLQNGKKRRKVLTFPSHRGPKIRMRDKGKQQGPPPKKARPGSKSKERQRGQMEKPTQPRNQKVKGAKRNFKSRDGDRFDSLVEQYKKKLTGNSDKNINFKRNKLYRM